ncbi:hypothetical protein Hanom_Chr02g00097471 [Helianthus anomalus]
MFKTKGNVRLATYFTSVNMKRTRTPENEDRNSVGCLAMFGSLELQPEVREVVDSIVERLKTLSHKSDIEFVAVDLRLHMLDQKGCQGFDKNSAVYLTQSRWDNSLDSLKDLFPKTYTKMDKKQKFWDRIHQSMKKWSTFTYVQRVMCSCPLFRGCFMQMLQVKGSGKTKIVVPDDSASAGSELGNYISRYVSKKSHMAYSCFC